MFRSLARAGACVCVGALLVAACGGGSDHQTDSRTGNTTIGDPATASATTNATLTWLSPCSFISKAEAAALIGGTATKTPDSPPPAVEPACVWEGTVGGVNYLLQVRIGDGEQYYTGNIAGNEKLDGLGDKAAIREAGNGSEETISVLKDSLSVTVALSAHKIGTTGLAKAKRDQLIAIVKSATANL